MRIFIALAATLFLAVSAHAQTISKLTPDNVGATLAVNGLRYVESADNRGFPMLLVETAGYRAENINVFFYGCGTQGCEDITLYSWFQPVTPVTSQQINTWNDIFQSSRNWSRAYVDEEGDVVLVMNINATGGIGSDALQILVNTFLVEVQDFGTRIGASVNE